MTIQPSIRQDHLDCAHGLMILHMMFFHLCNATIIHKPYYYSILKPLSFFMAWFFFKSGMFYKVRSIIENIHLGFKRIIIPAAVFSLIGFIFYLLPNLSRFNYSLELKSIYYVGAIPGNTPLWFLFSLFVVQIIFSIMRKYNIHPILIVIIALGLYYLSQFIGFRPYWTYNIPIGLLFYSLGLLFKKLQYNRHIVILSLIIYFGLLLYPFNIDFLLGKFTPNVIAIPWALAGCILINALFKYFTRLCIFPLRFFGRHAMEFYCTHIIIIVFLENHIKHHTLHISPILFIIFAFIIYLLVFSLILHFFKLKKIQWMFGR